MLGLLHVMRNEVMATYLPTYIPAAIQECNENHSRDLAT
jgi:hypothetical protein